MKQNKYFTLLKTLSEKELKDYKKFLCSPIHTSSSAYMRFYEYFKSFSPTYESKDISKQSMYDIFYPDDAYSDKKLRDRLTHALKLLKEFIAFNNFKCNELERRKHLLLGIKDKNVQQLFEEEYKAIESILENRSIKDEEYYNSKYFFGNIYKNYLKAKTKGQEKIKIYKSSDGIDDVLNFFLIVILKEYSRMSNNKREIEIDYKFELYEKIINLIPKEEKNFKKVPLVMLLFKFRELCNAEKNSQFILDLYKDLKSNKQFLNREIYEIFGIELYNYCKRMQSSGHKEFGHISFKLMSTFLPEDIFFETNGYLTAHSYINLAATAIRENQMNWAEDFINNYKEKVNETERENAFNYNYSVLFYMKGYAAKDGQKILLYDKALERLSLVKTEDYYYMTRIKNHEMKIYYELDYVDNVISLIDSYSHYLNRTKLVPKHLRERYMNFIRCVEKLQKIKLGHGSMSKEQYKEYIKKKENLAFKGWILDRIEGLK